MNLQLTKWQAHWNDADDVDLENRSTLRIALKTFVNGPRRPKLFMHVVPFRISGQNVADNDTYESGFIKNICRLSTEGTVPEIFEAVTLDGVTIQLAADEMIQ